MIVIFTVNGLCNKGHIRMGNWVSIPSGRDGLPCGIRFIEVYLGYYKQNFAVGCRTNQKRGCFNKKGGGG